MNFLAHIYLSGDDPLLKIGNFMADGIRGKQLDHFPEGIRKGVVLHRAIDTFTDAHPIFRTSTKRLHPFYHHHSGIIVDVFYDHFLAKNWNQYKKEPLEEFSLDFYNSLENNYSWLTDKTKNMLPYIKKYNWLLNYQHVDEIARILSQMDKRMSHPSKMGESVKELKAFYVEFENEFIAFFEEVQQFCTNKLTTL